MSLEPCQKVAGKIMESSRGLFVGIEHDLLELTEKGQCQWLELNKKVAPLYLKKENGKLHTNSKRWL
jgi:hypothetical protein